MPAATYDIVHTAVGARMCLPDITRWAANVAALQNPGDELYPVEFHPTEWTLAEDEYPS